MKCYRNLCKPHSPLYYSPILKEFNVDRLNYQHIISIVLEFVLLTVIFIHYEEFNQYRENINDNNIVDDDSDDEDMKEKEDLAR